MVYEYIANTNYVFTYVASTLTRTWQFDITTIRIIYPTNTDSTNFLVILNWTHTKYMYWFPYIFLYALASIHTTCDVCMHLHVRSLCNIILTLMLYICNYSHTMWVKILSEYVPTYRIAGLFWGGKFSQIG